MVDEGVNQTAESAERAADAGARSWIALYALAIFASAFLIFLVQPMVGKRILPWFGGVAAVWTLCLAFYQTTLFAGYAYAHLLIRYASPRAQLGIHTVAVAAALVSLPVLPSSPSVALQGGDPTLEILRLLGANVALPFLVLASTGPLVQAWFARAYAERSPYPLYAVSNLGSLLALFAYPFLLEPRLPLSDTGTLWSLAFGVTAFSVLACALPSVRAGSVVTGGGDAAGQAPRGRRDPLDVALWLLLSGCAVVLLMGVTNKLCLDVASIPFLWILPLTTYLLTFILCFSSEAFYRRGPLVAIAAIAFVLTLGRSLWFDWVGPGDLRIFLNSLSVQIATYCALLFGACMILHGELYRLRPAARSLTLFYLCVSGGGALAGLFVGIAAPLLFDGYYELELGFALACVCFLVVRAHDPTSWRGRGAPRLRWSVIGLLSVVLFGYTSAAVVRSPSIVRHRERSFFGLLRVLESGQGAERQHQLQNGTTLHGVEFMSLSYRMLPTSYYGRATGLGLALAERPGDKPRRIGVVGLGVGTVAAYGRPGDLMRFYEVDPAVVRIARDDGYFAFLAGTPADVEVVVGDARLQLADEQARGVRQDFDFLIVDAFSSDAVPVHLLTREAFVHYMDALAPDGVMAVHVSNRHFELRGLVSRMASEVGAQSLQVANTMAPKFQSIPARWVMVARDREVLDGLSARMQRRRAAMGLARRAVAISPPRDAQLKRTPVWTDDYSDLFGLLRAKW